jgi:hypothetical protein
MPGVKLAPPSCDFLPPPITRFHLQHIARPANRLSAVLTAARVKELAVPALLAAGLGLRLWYVWALKWNAPNADEAVAGLMAMHIAEGKELPVFFYGQHYFGALEPYLNALLFRLAGLAPNLIYAFPVLFSLALVWLGYRIALSTYGGDVAVLSAALLSLAPAAFLFYALSAGGGFALAALLQLAAIWLFAQAYHARIGGWRVAAAFGLISGLLFWVWQLYMLLFVAFVLAWILGRRPIRLRASVAGFVPFVLGSFPLWLDNVRTHGATFSDGLGKFAGNFVIHRASLSGNLAPAAATGSAQGPLATVVAFADSLIQRRQAYAYMGEWLGDVILVLLVACGVLLYIYYAQRRSRERDINLTLLLVSLVLLAIGHALRYLIVVPFLLIPCAVSGWRRLLGRGASIIVFVAIVANLLTVQQTILHTFARDEWEPALTALQRNHLEFGYSDYWDAYPITFLSHEEVIVTALLRTPAGGRSDRYPKYATMVHSDVVGRAGMAFVLIPDDSPDRAAVFGPAAGPSCNAMRQSIPELQATLCWPVAGFAIQNGVLTRLAR